MIGSKELWKHIGVTVLIMTGIVVIFNTIMKAMTESPVLVLIALAAIMIIIVYKKYENKHH